MSVDWVKVANDFHMAQPHPAEPRLTVGDFATAVKLATRARFGGHADGPQAAAFWSEFTGMNQQLANQSKPQISPEEFGQILDRTAPLSFAYHGRPPSMAEVLKLRDAEPVAIKKYFGDLPHGTYPHVTAADMAKYLTLAEPMARMVIQRPPNELEAARFALGGFNEAAIGDYYRAVSGQAEMRPNLEPPVAGDWGSVKPGVGPPETGIGERRGGDRHAPEPWGPGHGPERRAPEPAPVPEQPAGVGPTA